MKRALRLVSVQQGHDPRTFALLAYGGAGPLHAAQLAKEMSIPQVIIPPAAGVLSALGLLASDTRREFVSSVLKDFSKIEPEFLQKGWEKLKESVDTNIEETKLECRNSLDMRYSGQSHSLRVPVKKIEINRGDLRSVRETFDDLHERRYGYSKSDEPVEVVNQRLEIIGKTEDLSLLPQSNCQEEDPVIGNREVVFSDEPAMATVYRYELLDLAEPISGPAIIHSRDSTIVVNPNQSARLNRNGSMIIEV
jgi:N-methylhydantoinase A